MEGKGIEQLKDLTDEWLQEYQKEKQAAQQAAQQNPAAMKAQIDMAKVQQKGQIDNARLQLDMAKLQQDQQKVMADLHLGQQSATVQLVKAQTERYAKHVDLQMQHHDMKHRHVKEVLETHHRLKQKSEGNRAHA